MRIAIAVEEDKQTIVKRTGQAAFFAIYEDTKAVNYIANTHGKGHSNHTHEHSHKDMGETEHTNKHKKDIAGLKGCDIILVQVVGENMKEALESIGLKVKKIRKKDGASADEAIKNFIEGKV